jgi:hypothetical protein
MLFRITQTIKYFAFAIFLVSVPINGMENNRSAISQLLIVARENKGKLLLASGVLVTAGLFYKFRSPIKRYINSCKQSLSQWLLTNEVLSNARTSDPIVIERTDWPEEENNEEIISINERENNKNISIINQDGDIKVEVHNKLHVSLLVAKKATTGVFLQQIKRTLSQVNNDFEIRTEKDNDRVNALIHYILKIPKNLELDELRLTAGSGSIYLNCDKSKITIADTEKGHITVAVPELNAKINLKTINGSIKNDFLLASGVESVSIGMKTNELIADIGTATHQLTLTSEKGNITLKKSSSSL